MLLGVFLLIIGALIVVATTAFFIHTMVKQSRWTVVDGKVTKVTDRKDPQGGQPTPVAIYRYLDEKGRTQSGRTTGIVSVPKAKSTIKIAYNPADPSVSERAFEWRRPSSWVVFALMPLLGVAAIVFGILLLLEG